MELNRRTWTAAVKLALGLSFVATVLAALVALRVDDVPPVAVVVPMTVVAFAASWIQTGRIRRGAVLDTAVASVRRPSRNAV